MRIPEDLSYDQNGLIPVIIQDSATKEVLMLAYMNQESLRRTLKGGLTCFWSRSRKEYWVKGATSGNIQRVKAIRVDCDADALLIEVEQVGVACHEGYRSCFFREMLPEGGLQVLLE
jgi:phosphoribosyl-AMP cyclohydrolase